MSRGPEIIIKDKEKVRALGYKIFMGAPHDKGCAKPAWCYRKRLENLREDVRDMQRNIDLGNVSNERRGSYEAQLKKMKDRLKSIEDSHAYAREIYEGDKEYYDNRVKELGEKISAEMPTREQEAKRMVNPHTTLKKEQSGLKYAKIEYQVLQRLREDESNISFLQRDK